MKRRLYLSIATEIYEKLQAAVDKRDVSKSDIVEDALKAELNVTSLRVDLQRAERRYLAGSEILEQKKADLRATKSQLEEVEQKSVALEKQIGLFKQKFEEAVANLQYAEAKIKAYQRQNWFQRLFNRPLVILPYDKVEPRKGERLWDTPAKPINPTPDTPVETEIAKLREQLHSETKQKEALQDALNNLEGCLASAGIHPPYSNYVKVKFSQPVTRAPESHYCAINATECFYRARAERE